MTKRVLMIGGAGFIGANLREAFLRRGDWVGTLDPRGAGLELPNAFVLPLQAATQVEQLLRDHSVDAVVHLASSLLPSSDAQGFHDELAQVIGPTFRLIDTCAKASIPFVLFSSGGTVYGDTDDPVIGEAHALEPKSRYGYAKVLLEDYVRFASRNQGLRYLIVRPSNPYGRHQRVRGAQGIIAVALGKLLNDEPLEIWGDGSSVRDYVDVRDLAEAVSALVHLGITDSTLNIGSGTGHSVHEVLAIIHAVIGKRLRIVELPARSTDVRQIVLDTRALRSLIDWRPRELEVGIRDFARHLGLRDA